MITPNPSEETSPEKLAVAQALIPTLVELPATEAVKFLEPYPADLIVIALELLNPAMAHEFLHEIPNNQRQKLMAAASPATRRQWMRNEAYADDSIGAMMEPPLAVYLPGTTIKEAIVDLRHLARHAFITYAFVAGAAGKLIGVVAMREMLLSENPAQKLEEIMIENPFHLTPEMTLTEAMKATLTRHFPVYPVCDDGGRLVGLVRGQMLFEAQAIELSAQAGSMVGVEREERLSTPWRRSLNFRHPWLQLNLFTAFIAAAVVGVFQDTIDRLVVLAVFLPVLAGQSGNTGCQALAVALRGITLGELKAGKERILVAKEALLGLCNGALVGVTAGIGMFIYATMQKNPDALSLAVIVWVAMIGSCVVSGISGALVPLTLKRLGADPATASSIFLTTATDVVSMGTFLSLATIFI